MARCCSLDHSAVGRLRRDDKAKCILDSTADGGHILARLANDESLGRELRTYLQTDKYVANKNDGKHWSSRPSAFCGSVQRTIGSGATDSPCCLVKCWRRQSFSSQASRSRSKSTSPEMVLWEAMEYLVKNSFTKMSFLKKLTPEADRLKELQSILRSNDIAKEQLLSNT